MPYLPSTMQLSHTSALIDQTRLSPTLERPLTFSKAQSGAIGQVFVPYCEVSRLGSFAMRRQSAGSRTPLPESETICPISSPCHEITLVSRT